MSAGLCAALRSLKWPWTRPERASSALGKGYDRCDLREIGIGGRPGQETQRILAAGRIPVAEPWALAMAAAEASFLKRLLQGQRPIAIAHDLGIARVRAR